MLPDGAYIIEEEYFDETQANKNGMYPEPKIVVLYP